MTRLEHVGVEGFKGVERVEFDPGMVNVVTGRNNSGKTSLLEAIELACEPSAIERFAGNHGGLIRESAASARVEIVAESGQRQLNLSTPDESGAQHVLSNLFERRLSEAVDRAQSQVDIEQTTARSELRSVTSEYTDRIDAQQHVLLVSTDDETYGYVWHSEQLSDVLLEATLELHARLTGDATSNEERRPPFGVGVPSSDRSQNGFVGGTPDRFTRVSLFDVSEVNSVAPEIDSEEHAVRRDNLGEYLQNHMVEELKSFDFDYLVFAENGEKRSVPFEFMGEGFKSISRILWELFAADLPDVVLLEEPETHMHPGYVRQLTQSLVELARDEQVQLFITTHNSDFLNDFFDPALSDEEREFLEEEFRLVQMQNGYAGVKSYEEAEESLKELQIDLRGI